MSLKTKDMLLPIKEEPELELESLQVKQELDENFDYTVGESAAAAGLYADHQIKSDVLVLGPTVLQKSDIVFTRAGTWNNRKGIVTSSEDYDPSQAQDLHSGARYEDWLQLRVCSVRLARLSPDLHKHANNRIPSTVQKQINHQNEAKGPQASALTEYSCSTCGEHFVRKQSLKLHTQLCSTQNNVVRHEQTEDKPYKCIFCLKHFSQKGALILHEKIHIGQSSNCKYCLKRFPTKQTLIQHVRIHTKPYKCEICLKQFSRLDHLNAHKYTHTGDKPYKCELCLTQFTQKMHLTIHKRAHTGEKPYKCEVCMAEFSKVKQLRVHKYVHTGEKQYKCDICSKQFSYKHPLVLHIEGHMGVRRPRPARQGRGVYPCPVCRALYDRQDRLLRHARKHIWPTEQPTGHTVGRRPEKNPRHQTVRLESQTNSGIKSNGIKDCAASELYCCDACGEKFARKRSLIRHIKLHSSDLHKQRSKDIDNDGSQLPTKNTSTGLPVTERKSLPDKGTLTQVEDDLVRYELGYTNDKSHKCRYCIKRFYIQSHLVRHERIHTGEKPYKCDICLRQFTVSSSLKSHKRTHTGEKPYKCDICLKEFAQSGTLLGHKRTHSGEKPYKCDFCWRSFRQQTALVSHRRTHTGAKPYKCDICLRRFPRSDYLRSHQCTHSKK